jgi:RNA polymerase sigma-32 factor
MVGKKTNQKKSPKGKKISKTASPSNKKVSSKKLKSIPKKNSTDPLYLPVLVANKEENWSPVKTILDDQQGSGPGTTQLTVFQSQLPTKDPLVLYLRQIANYKLLSPEQELALARALHESGDVEIAKKLVLANLRLVVKIALEYRRAHQNVMDLIQEGNLGLMKAVSKYDHYKGAKLSYYASWWIRSYILKFVLDNFRLVKLGTTNEQKKLFFNLIREKNRLLSMGVDPDYKTIGENLGVSEKSVAMMDQRLGGGGVHEMSLDAPVNEESQVVVGDFIGTETAPVGDQLAHLEELTILNNHLGDFLNTLKNYRDREIFRRRLLDEIPASLQSIAYEYGVSRERIRQIEERLIKNLRVYMSEYLG